MTHVYDELGTTYTVTRRTDLRIARAVETALDGARTLVNVGAGTGSYEPHGSRVIAVEPSAVMRAQRPADAAPCVAAAAEHLPFADGAFDAATAVSTVEHWLDPVGGLREMRRVARRVVVLCFDATRAADFWLTRDYLPEAAGLFAGRPAIEELAAAISARIDPVPVPWNCADGFYHAFWRRPAAYLDSDVRAGMSVWARVGRDAERRAMSQLRLDLTTGRWAERQRDVLGRDAVDFGLRLLVA